MAHGLPAREDVSLAYCKQSLTTVLLHDEQQTVEQMKVCLDLQALEWRTLGFPRLPTRTLR